MPDRLKDITYAYKKALAGFLIGLQEEIFGYLERISHGDVDDELIYEAFSFIKRSLSMDPPEEIKRGGGQRESSILFPD